MDTIRQAINRARAAVEPVEVAVRDADRRVAEPVRSVRLDEAHLERARIVAYAGVAGQGRYYDMLRTQVLHDMERNGWQCLAVTSPTVGCGKTVTACNLALSIARLPERAALLVDADMQRPKVAEYLGLPEGPSLLGVLEERYPLASAIVDAQAGPNRIEVLSGGTAAAASSEWLASQTMANVLQAMRRDFRSRVVVFDLPPLLVGDDVISILPRMDAVLLVTAVGATSPADVCECQKHLQNVPVVRVVVNKVDDPSLNYYGYY